MKRKNPHTEFKAVEFMRKRRDELSELYSRNPSGFWEELEKIRKKYKNKFYQKKKTAPYKTKHTSSIAAEPKEKYGK